MELPPFRDCGQTERPTGQLLRQKEVGQQVTRNDSQARICGSSGEPKNILFAVAVGPSDSGEIASVQAAIKCVKKDVIYVWDIVWKGCVNTRAPRPAARTPVLTG